MQVFSQVPSEGESLVVKPTSGLSVYVLQLRVESKLFLVAGHFDRAAVFISLGVFPKAIIDS